MKVWITKYALSKGILEVEGDPSSCPTMFCVGGPMGHTDYYHKPYWHETQEAAMVHADEMRVRRIASMRKQIVKLEKLQFLKEAA